MKLGKNVWTTLTLLVLMNCAGFSQVTDSAKVTYLGGLTYEIKPAKYKIDGKTYLFKGGFVYDGFNDLPRQDAIVVTSKGIVSDTVRPDTGSTRIPNANLRGAIKLIESLRIDSLLLSNDKRILSERVTVRDITINLLTERIDIYKLLIANYDKQVANLNAQMKLSESLSKSLNKRLKWANTKTVLAGTLGIVATILAAVYIK